jgi:hypothetical protein
MRLEKCSGSEDKSFFEDSRAFLEEGPREINSDGLNISFIQNTPN